MNFNNITDSLMSTLSKYATFSGRSARPEWVIWYVSVLVINLVLNAIVGITGGSDGNSPFSWLVGLFGLAVLLPSLAVGVRRFHDQGKSGWWLLINLIPIVGWIIYIVMQLQPGQPGPNQYGPAPEADAGGAAQASNWPAGRALQGYDQPTGYTPPTTQAPPASYPPADQAPQGYGAQSGYTPPPVQAPPVQAPPASGQPPQDAAQQPPTPN